MGFPVTVVLGASGRIGSVLRQEWQPYHDRIRWQARRAAPRPRADEDWHLLDPLARAPKGLAAPDDLAQLMTGAEVLLCLAGSIPGRGKPGQDVDLADNSRLALAAVEAAAEATGAAAGTTAPARVFLCSSAAVYGNQSGLLQESAALRPANAYGEAKAEMEQRAARRAQELGVQLCALRIGNIAGLDAVLGGWRPGFRLDHFADGQSPGHSPRRSYIGVQALARILAALVAVPNLPSILNLAQPGAVEMAALLRAAGRDYEPVPAPDHAIAEVQLDLELLQQILPGHPDLMTAADPIRLVAEWIALNPASGPLQTAAANRKEPQR